MTIAASGQGRWREELEFPGDCRSSGFTPVLIVLDPTRNVKLDELEAAFKAQTGDVFIGLQAWSHLAGLAGDTMARFLERYIHEPLQALLDATTTGPELPELVLRMDSRDVHISVEGESFALTRTPAPSEYANNDAIPEDADGLIPGS